MFWASLSESPSPKSWSKLSPSIPYPASFYPIPWPLIPPAVASTKLEYKPICDYTLSIYILSIFFIIISSSSIDIS